MYVDAYVTALISRAALGYWYNSSWSSYVDLRSFLLVPLVWTLASHFASCIDSYMYYAHPCSSSSFYLLRLAVGGNTSSAHSAIPPPFPLQSPSSNPSKPERQRNLQFQCVQENAKLLEMYMYNGSKSLSQEGKFSYLVIESMGL